MEIKNVAFESVNTDKLSENEIIQISNVEKDMWAYWIWEYVKCNNCWSIHSKNDIYWHLENHIKTESVTTIEKILWLDSIKCKKCNNDTEFIYDEKTNIKSIKDRLFNSDKSYISIMRNFNNWDIYWFMDWYIDTFKNIYDREFKEHYANIWSDKIINRVESKIWYIPEKFLSFSSMWTFQKYVSFYNVFNLIKFFFNWIEDNKKNLLWITELDTWSNLHWFHHSMWIQKLWITDNFEDINLLSNLNSSYNTDLYIQPMVVKTYKEWYNLWVKDFIKKNKKVMKEVLVA